MILLANAVGSAIICDCCSSIQRIFLCISLMQTYSLVLRVHTDIHTKHAHAKRVMPRNNPLCRLIDQITSRWNTLPNSAHRPSGTGHFYSCSLTLIAPSISPNLVALPSPMAPLADTSGWKSRESAIFYFTYVERNSSMWNH